MTTFSKWWQSQFMVVCLHVCIMQSASRRSTIRALPTPLFVAVTLSGIFLLRLSAVYFRLKDRKRQKSDTAKLETVPVTSAKGLGKLSGVSNPQTFFVGHHKAIRARLLASSNHQTTATTRQCSRTVGNTLRTAQFVWKIAKKVCSDRELIAMCCVAMS